MARITPARKGKRKEGREADGGRKRERERETTQRSVGTVVVWMFGGSVT